jgi:hypothetical protein
MGWGKRDTCVAVSVGIVFLLVCIEIRYHSCKNDSRSQSVGLRIAIVEKGHIQMGRSSSQARGYGDSLRRSANGENGSASCYIVQMW